MQFLTNNRRRKKMETVKKLTINVLQRATNWVEKETTVMKSKFESRFIKTVRSMVVLACVLTLINVILVLKG
jgi:hypothetical protein